MYYLGLYKENHHFRAAVLYVKKNTVFLEDFYERLLSEEAVKPFYKAVEKYMEETCFIGALLPAKKVLIREKEVKLPSKELNRALPFILEEMIPYDPKETLYTTKRIKTEMNGSKLSVIATKRENLEELREEMKVSGFECDFIGNEYSALLHTAQFLHEDAKAKAIFYISKEKILFILSLGTDILFTYNAYFDSHDIGIDDESFFEEKLNRHLQRIEAYLKEKQEEFLSTSQLCVFCKSAFIQKRISEVFDMPLSSKKDQEATLSSFAMPIGVALQCYKQDAPFLSADFVSQRHLKRNKKRLLASLIPIGATLTLLLCSNGIYSYLKQKELSHRLLALDASPYQRLKYEELDKKLKFTENKFLKEKQSLSFLFAYPNVSDALAWLSSQPVLCKIDEKTGQRVEVEHVEYKVEEKEGKTLGVYLEIQALFPTVDTIHAFQKSLEKDPFLDKKHLNSFKEEGLLCSFKLYLNPLWGEK